MREKGKLNSLYLIYSSGDINEGLNPDEYSGDSEACCGNLD